MHCRYCRFLSKQHKVQALKHVTFLMSITFFQFERLDRSAILSLLSFFLYNENIKLVNA